MKEFRNKTYFEDSIALPTESGRGIQLGSYANGPEVGTNSSEFGWRDLTSDASVLALSTASPFQDPTFTQIGTTGFWFYRFTIGDHTWFNYKIPHDIYIPPSGAATIHFHAHWLVDDSASPYSGACTWQWTYAFAKGFNQEAFDFSLANSPQTTAKIITATQDSGIPFQHMVVETAAVTIPGLSEPDGFICVQLERISNGTSPLDELSSEPFLIAAGVHYQSTNIATIGKEPSFYE